MDIYGNQKLRILAVACLCSCKNLQLLVAHGFQFSVEELQFLTKTFESTSSRMLELETEDGYDVANIMNMFAEEVFEDEMLF